MDRLWGRCYQYIILAELQLIIVNILILALAVVRSACRTRYGRHTVALRADHQHAPRLFEIRRTALARPAQLAHLTGRRVQVTFTSVRRPRVAPSYPRRRLSLAGKVGELQLKLRTRCHVTN
jgi:hypothetical protein